MPVVWRTPEREDRQVAALWSVCAGLSVLFRPLWIAAAGLLPRCVWHAATGWPCPGCGATRAVVHLLNADPAGAFAYNPLAASAAVLFVAGGVLAPVWLLCGGRAVSIEARSGRRLATAAALLVMANWAWVSFAGA